MGSDRSMFDGMQGELRALRRQVADLADSLRSMASRSAGEGHEAAWQAGRQLMHAGGQAGELARRHPAATGLTLLAVAGTVVCLAMMASRNARGR